MIHIDQLSVTPISMITHEGLQRIDLHYRASEDAHLYLNVYHGNQLIHQQKPVSISSGQSYSSVFLIPPDADFEATWQLIDPAQNLVAEETILWQTPRRWTFYTMVSSHTDIGLHNSPYIQRYNSERFLDQAMALCDQTEERDEKNRYHYVIEGTWFWGNYPADRGTCAAQKVVDDYIRKGKIGICGGVAGNHTQVYGLEELCRSAYGRKSLQEQWHIDTKTLAMIDNNGLSWSLVQPYADAGFENIIFAPNQWNPVPSTVWKCDTKVPGFVWNPEAGGGGARVDVRYQSALPMVFYWQSPDEQHQLLIWCSAQYGWGGAVFGMLPNAAADKNTLRTMEERFAKQLPILEAKYPYDLWLLACYEDDQEPNLKLTDAIKHWNDHYQWPQIRTLGNPDEPFAILRERFGGQIPVLRGELTGGWYQHPLSAPDLLAQKFAADRLLPTAEKLSVLAALTDQTFAYPREDFDRAWQYLLMNDEHSYGTSGYQGRRVYETWMQHRDWIEKAETIARQYSSLALAAIASQVQATEEKVLVFNPTTQPRCELVEHNGMECLVHDIPPFGYKTIGLSAFSVTEKRRRTVTAPPVVENQYYRLEFAANGAMRSIYDKQLARELLAPSAAYAANEFVYTNDQHQTFSTPAPASFEVIEDDYQTSVIVRTHEAISQADIIQQMTLPHHEKRIEIDNRLTHLRDMFNKKRYDRYAYYAFPFQVENGKRYCHLNGCIAEYGISVTGHGTDVYLPAHEWCCVENGDFGVALFQLDSQLIEFDHIHRDKTDFGDPGQGSAMYVYLANDWLQMHVPDGDHLNCRFRYAITSYKGSYQAAKIPQAAERFAQPVLLSRCGAHPGKLLPDAYSFIDLNQDIRLVNLKMAEDGQGLIARFLGQAKDLNFTLKVDGGNELQLAIVDEKDSSGICPENGFVTIRVGAKKIHLPVSESRPLARSGIPAAVSSEDNGLITKPRAACGEHQGHLYLLWGQNQDQDLSHYDLYRSEQADFIADQDTFLAKVEPGEYCVARYEDLDLSKHTWYYYRVCAVNKDNIRGPMSDVFSGLTRAAD